MSLYTKVRCILPSTRIELGWNPRARTYYFRAYEPTPVHDARFKPKEPEQLLAQGGTSADTRLETLYDLLHQTWAIVRWGAEPVVLRRLALDPVLEAHVARGNACLAAAAEDHRRPIDDLLRMVYGQPHSINLPPASSVRPTSAEADADQDEESIF